MMSGLWTEAFLYGGDVSTETRGGEKIQCGKPRFDGRILTKKPRVTIATKIENINKINTPA
jgi:hypothetical protein